MKIQLVSTMRYAMGLLVAPVVATFVVPTAYCGWAIFSGASGAACSLALAGYGWYGLVPAVFATAIFGWPLSLLAIRFGWVGCRHFLLGGSIVGMLAALLLYLLDGGFNLAGLATLTMATGSLAAIAVWVIGVRGNTMAGQ